jgi:DNA-binding XRE family transcriptional regulator
VTVLFLQQNTCKVKDSHAEHFLDALPFPSSYRVSRNIPLNVFNPRFPADPVTLGDVIRKLRIEQGLLQKELAADIGVDQMTIVNWEKSRTRPGKKYIQRLSAYFDLNPYESGATDES